MFPAACGERRRCEAAWKLLLLDKRDIKYTHQVSKITDLMKDLSFLLWLRMHYLFCNEPFFFLLSPYPISSFFPLSLSFYWILFSLSLFSLLTSIFFFSSITECLLVTEQLKLNMSTRRPREVLKSCGKKTYRCRQTEARFHTPDIYFTMAL